MVGGLVKQQHVGLGEQQSAQRHAALLATRELADDRIPRRQAQGIGCNFQLVLAVGACRGNDRLELGLLSRERVEVGIFLGVGRVDLFQTSTRGIDLGHRFLDFLAHRARGVELRLLRKVTYGQPWHGQRLAFELLVHARHDLEQRGFARAIEAEHADLRAREKRQRNVFQNLPLGWHGLGHAVHRKNILSHGFPCAMRTENDGSLAALMRQLSVHATIRGCRAFQ